jgi:hypothetical protein
VTFLPLSPCLFEFCSKPPTLACPTTFWAGSGCTSEDPPLKEDHPRPFPVAMSRPFRRIFVKTDDIPTTTTLTIRFLQQATAPFMRNHFPGRQCVYYERGSAKGGSSKTVPCCDESPIRRIFVKTDDITTTTLTRYIRVIQPATDAQRHWQLLGKQRVYYWKGSNKSLPSKTFRSRLESPVVRNLVNTGDIPTTLTRYIRVTQPATDAQRHWQPLGRQRVYY